MIFFITKGEPNSCGPGCSEWVAAEGRFEGMRIVAGSDVKTLQRMAPVRGDDKYQTFADRQFVQKALAAAGIVVTETFAPRNARPWSGEIRFPTAGLEQALRMPLKSCGAS
jgi:hypothetical protein